MSRIAKRTFCLAALLALVAGPPAEVEAAKVIDERLKTGHVLLAMSDQVRSMCEQAEQLINSQRFNDAIKLLQRAGSMEPACAEVHGYLGLAFQNSGNTKQAISEYQQALQLGPQMSFVNVNIGNCLLNLDQPDQAVPYFQRYLQENPNATDAAQVQMSIQKASSRKGQQNLRSTVEQGQALLNSGRYNEARRAFEQAIAIKPDFVPAHFFLGYTLAQSGEHQQAISEFQAALQLDPSMKEAVMNIASNYQSIGDCDSAINWYERYLQENPGSPKAGDIRNRVNGLRRQAGQQRPQARQAVRPLSGFPAQPGSPPAAYPGQGQSSPNQSAFASPVGGNALQSEDPYEGMVPPQVNSGQLNPVTNGYTGQVGPPQTANAGQIPSSGEPGDYLDNVIPGGRYFRWPVEKMPIRVFISSGADAAGYRDSFAQALVESFSAWAKGCENRLAFMRVQDPSQADIVCDWTGDPDKVQEAGRPVEGGLTKLSGQAQPGGVDVKIARARITLLIKDRGGTPLKDDEMKKVCLHEVGHALGLNGHSNNNHDVMFFSESPSVWPALSKRDKATISHLYANYPPVNIH